MLCLALIRICEVEEWQVCASGRASLVGLEFHHEGQERTHIMLVLTLTIYLLE